MVMTTTTINEELATSTMTPTVVAAASSSSETTSPDFVPARRKRQHHQQEVVNNGKHVVKSGSSSVHTIETTVSTSIVTTDDNAIEVQGSAETTTTTTTSDKNRISVRTVPLSDQDESVQCSSSLSNTIINVPCVGPCFDFMQRHMRKIGGLLFVAMIIYVIVDCSTSRYLLGLVSSLVSWMKDYPLGGAFAFTGMFVLGTVILLPGAVLAFGGGFVFSCTFGLLKGIVYGTLCVFLGSVIGSIISFVVARYLLRQQVKRLCRRYEKFECLDRALRRKGLHIMILLRLSPLIPYNIVNYLMGVTSASLKDYTLALVGLLPGIILLLFFGASAGSITDATMNSSKGRPSTAQIVTYVVGGVFGVVAVVVSAYYARKELIREAAQIEEEEKEQEEVDEEDCNSCELVLKGTAQDVEQKQVGDDEEKSCNSCPLVLEEAAQEVEQTQVEEEEDCSNSYDQQNNSDDEEKASVSAISCI